MLMALMNAQVMENAANAREPAVGATVSGPMMSDAGTLCANAMSCSTPKDLARGTSAKGMGMSAAKTRIAS